MPEASRQQPIALVTGGAGFIGVHTVEALQRSGWRVIVIDDLRHASWRALDPATDLLELDICSTPAREAVVRLRPGAILHLAAQGGVNRSWRDPIMDATNNVLGTINILSAAEEVKVPRVVMASSGGALYGDAGRFPTPEDQPPAPRSPYGTSKLAAEAYLGTYARIRGLSAMALRYGNVYGPGQDGTGEAGVVAITCSRLLQGEAAVIRGDGEQTRDFIYVGDVAAANVHALEAETGGAVNIGTGRETSVRQVIEVLMAAAAAPTVAQTTELPAGEVSRSCLAVEAAQSVLGWAAATSLEAGLEATWEAFSRQALHAGASIHQDQGASNGAAARPALVSEGGAQ